MSGHFEPIKGGGASVELDEVEISILRSLTQQLAELIGPGEEPADSEDPLASLFTEGPSEPPSDPALQRLFPDAYGDPEGPEQDDAELQGYSAEFRRFTENDLRDRKRSDALHVIRSLDALSAKSGGSGESRDGGEGAGGGESAAGGGESGGNGRSGRKRDGHGAGGGVLKLTPDESRQWLGTLNDLRLTIGTRLEVSDEDEGGELYRLPDSDPRKPMVMAYLWLGALQETLVETLMP
jgi:hypothetical protein